MSSQITLNPYFNPSVIPGLVWGWNGKVESDGKVKDLSLYHNDVTIGGTYVRNKTKVGHTTTFNGTDTVINLGDQPQYSFLNDAQGFTIVMIFQRVQNGSAEPLISKYSAAGITEYILGSIVTSNNYYFWSYDATGGGYRGRLMAPVTTVDSTYHLLIARKTNGVLTTNHEVWLDGVQKDTGNFTSGAFTQMRDTAAPLYIGFTPYGLGVNVYSNVIIGATGIYNRPLTDQERANIRAVFNASVARNIPIV